MTAIENITREGKPAYKLTCDCKTHAANANGAIVSAEIGAALAAKKGKAQSDRIHGFVTMANHPAKMMQVANARKGIFAA